MNRSTAEGVLTITISYGMLIVLAFDILYGIRDGLADAYGAAVGLAG